LGDIDPRSFTLDGVFDDLAARSGQAPADLVGYSMGGRLALAYAILRNGRVGRLVLEAASPGIAGGQERIERRASDETWARMLEAEGIEAFVAAWESQPLFETQARLGAEVRAKVRAARLRNEPRSLAAALRGLGAGILPSFWDDLDRLSIPVLLVVGAEDRKFVEIARRMATMIRRVRLVVVAGAGHTVHLERPDAWLEAVTSFLTMPAPADRSS
jgi:2-succinyl-6-hydroxy-2,4-cyclohexadiene-1-carboxylate synthase